MSKNENIKKLKAGLFFKAFRMYVRFFHNVIFYRRRYVINKENVPANGTPLMIVSNHQNCMNDPLAIVYSFKRKANFITRADIFQVHRWINKFWRFVGLLPAFRLDYEGEDTLEKNAKTFDDAGHELLSGRTVIIYPEAGHQDKRWLGTFSFGYTKLAFGAAEKGNFQTDILILPSCNHYSNYFSMQEDILIKYGTPISLAPFYELYQSKPRTAQRQVNELVRSQINELMLNIDDLENYDAIDYLRCSCYGAYYARRKGLDPASLPDKLTADKALAAEILALKEKEGDAMQGLFRKLLELKEKTLGFKIRDWNFEKKFSLASLFGRGFLYVLLFPLFLLSLIPNILVFLAPKPILWRFTDKMFYSTINLGVSVMITIPILYSIFTALCWMLTHNIWITLAYLLSLPFLGLFAWYYRKTFIKWKSEIRFYRLRKKGKLKEAFKLRDEIIAFLNKKLTT